MNKDTEIATLRNALAQAVGRIEVAEAKAARAEAEVVRLREQLAIDAETVAAAAQLLDEERKA